LEEKIRVRFAPSPTGELHVGNARTALFNWLFARQRGGKFILRLEDTDRARALEIYEQNLYRDLRWLGLDWDEGPDIGGPFGPYRQSERLSLYDHYLQELIAKGEVYPCYCSEEELEKERNELLSKGLMPRYTGRCRYLTKEERNKREDQGIRPAYRFKVEGGSINFKDMLRGEMRFESRAIGDFIIVRSNGLPAYNFACVIDDHLMEITHVIRGEDHLTNTASQVLLYQALGFPLPVFAHHSLILGKDRTKLSKRHGATSVREFRSSGILAEALVNYLALIGNSFGAGKEVCLKEELLALFALEKTGKGGAIFTPEKLHWLNSLYIKNYSSQKIAALYGEYEREIGENNKPLSDERLIQIIDAVKDNVLTLADIRMYLAIFDDQQFTVTPQAKEIIREGEAKAVLEFFYDYFETHRGEEVTVYREAVREIGKKMGRKGRQVFLPLRCALTGNTSGPELEKIIQALGRDSIMRRLKMVSDSFLS